MTLEPIPTVPQTLGGGELPTVGGKLALAVDAGGVTLVLTCPHPSIARLDLAGVQALCALLTDAAQRMKG